MSEQLKIATIKEIVLIMANLGVNITDDTTMRDAGLDSLDRVELEIKIEQEFNLYREDRWITETDTPVTICNKINPPSHD